MYSRILVPIDGSDVSDAGAADALKLAAGLGATVRFFNVIDLTHLARSGEGLTVYAGQLTDVARTESAKLLDDARERASAAGVKVETGSAEIMTGRPGDEIVQEAVRSKAELVVMGTHGRRGLQRAMLGSDADTVVRHASCPVLLVPSRKR
jgi:nucleotide-binding universal stress UspA family protein